MGQKALALSQKRMLSGVLTCQTKNSPSAQYVAAIIEMKKSLLTGESVVLETTYIPRPKVMNAITRGRNLP